MNNWKNKLNKLLNYIIFFIIIIIVLMFLLGIPVLLWIFTGKLMAAILYCGIFYGAIGISFLILWAINRISNITEIF